MIVDTVIRNGKIVNPGGVILGGLAVDAGKIVAIAEDGNLPEGRKLIDAAGNYILPGIIDPHVHIGLFHSFEEEINDTDGAAFGGITTIGNYVGMRMSAQRDSYEFIFDRWKDIWEKRALVDVFFHGGIISDTNLKEIKINAQRRGITSFKFMMNMKGPEVKQTGYDPMDDGALWTGFCEISALGYPARAMVHAENREIMNRTELLVKNTGRQDLAAWTDAHPGFCETLDVEKAISFAKLTKAPLYIVHAANADTVNVIARAKEQGLDVVGETCPHYLTLTQSAPLGALGKVGPPLKDEMSKERLWQGIKIGTISCLGSDHCSTTKEQKKDIWGALPGMPGLESFLPIMLSEGVNKGRITLEQLVRICCHNTAKIFGIYPKKGVIQVGSDADIVIVDLNKKARLSAASSHYSIADFTPYEGWEIKGWPVLTMLRGNIVVEGGKMVGKAGIGRYIPISVSKRQETFS